jgi:hypothetical protein
MKIHSLLAIMLISLSLSFSAFAVAQAAPNQAAQSGNSAYPGAMPNGGRIDVASSLVQSSLHAYYRLNGAWPKNWKAVVDAGLFSGSLTTPAGQTIDPDDINLDFLNDLHYDARGQTDRALIVAKIGTAKMPIQYIWMDPCATYQFRLSDAAANDSTGCFNGYLNDPNRAKQFAQIFLLIKGIDLYTMVKGHLPDSLDAMMRSGLCAYSTAPTNPYTGQPYRFDASANDLYFNKIVDPNGKEVYRLRHVMPDGSLPTCVISY